MRTGLWIILGLWILTGPAMAAVSMGQGNMNEYYYPNNQATATGVVQRTGPDFIEIYNEDLKRKERYIDLGNQGPFQKGDHIRIFYNPFSDVIINIKRMPILKYDAKTQNLGHIYVR